MFPLLKKKNIRNKGELPECKGIGQPQHHFSCLNHEIYTSHRRFSFFTANNKNIDVDAVVEKANHVPNPHTTKTNQQKKQYNGKIHKMGRLEKSM